MTPYDSTTPDRQNSIAPQRKTLKHKPSREEAEKAVEILLRWAGDDPSREGLLDTPARVIRAYEEFFSGYQEDPEDMLARTFEEVEGYDDMVMLRGIDLQSHCEHHMVPILGQAHIAYLPDRRVVGISKLARVLDSFGKRLQTQETMTAQVANAIQNALRPKGVAILVDAQHQCMTTRGVKVQGVNDYYSFHEPVEEDDLRERFYRQIKIG